jgi:NitT/TauT family transport system permease protein
VGDPVARLEAQRLVGEELTLRFLRRAAAGVWGVRYAIGAVLAVLVVWEIAARADFVKSSLLPAPDQVASAFWDNRSILLNQTWVTLKEALQGFALSVLMGIPLGVLLAMSRTVDRAVRPVLVAGQVTPKVALAPIFLVVFGLGSEPKIVLSFLLAFFPIVLDTILGLRSVQVEKIYLARSCGAGWITILAKIRIPNAMPLIMTGLKIGATLSVTGAIVAEFISPGHGLGYTLQTAGAELKTDLLYAAIFCLGVLGLGMFLVITQIERRTVAWHPSQRNRAGVGRR